MCMSGRHDRFTHSMLNFGEESASSENSSGALCKLSHYASRTVSKCVWKEEVAEEVIPLPQSGPNYPFCGQLPAVSLLFSLAPLYASQYGMN